MTFSFRLRPLVASGSGSLCSGGGRGGTKSGISTLVLRLCPEGMTFSFRLRLIGSGSLCSGGGKGGTKSGISTLVLRLCPEGMTFSFRLGGISLYYLQIFNFENFFHFLFSWTKC